MKWDPIGFKCKTVTFKYVFIVLPIKDDAENWQGALFFKYIGIGGDGTCLPIINGIGRSCGKYPNFGS